jgi:hypothetical protein
MPADYYTGLDLGQQQDFTALAVLERSFGPDAEHPQREVSRYAVRHLERLPLGTAYTAVGGRLVRLFAKPPLRDTALAIDSTGVGRAVVDLLRQTGIRAAIRPITITGGDQVNSDEKGGWRVPKKDLVSVLQVLRQSRRLKVAPSLPEARTLARELENFQVQVTEAAHETFGAWRDGTHDDLVLAAAVAAWQGERAGPVLDALPLVLGRPRRGWAY